MTCHDCERHKLSASMWRNEAYKHAGTPLPWKPEELLREEYERGLIDGMQKQMQSSVDKAVNSMTRTWVGLTQQDIDIAFDDTQEGGGFDDFARAIEAKLKEKNTCATSSAT